MAWRANRCGDKPLGIGEAMTVGAVAEPVLRRGSDYAQLSRRIVGAGLMERRPGWYVVR